MQIHHDCFSALIGLPFMNVVSMEISSLILALDITSLDTQVNVHKTNTNTKSI